MDDVDTPERRCEHCGRTADDIAARPTAKTKTGRRAVLMVEMEPGRDGKAWQLCVECWLPGRVDRPVGEQTRREPTPKAVKVTRQRQQKKRA